ncbi:MAG: hypothetical protein IPP99_18285 [Chitinophagaceae bacterium]|nr:hypothetical protein [Chitinophagaceae bacterium]
MRKTFRTIFLGTLVLSVVAVACNNKKENKEEPAKVDTPKVETAPVTAPVDTPANGDTLVPKPVKPGE